MSEQSTTTNPVGRALVAGLDKAIAIHQPIIAAHVRRLRERHPDAEPARIITMLEKHYLATVIGTGAAAGGVSAAPAVGTAASIAVSLGETVGFLEASALFCLSVADVHGLQIDDLERRRTLLLAVLLGDSGASFVEKAAARTGKHWGKLLTDAIPMSTINNVNKVLGRWFITKYGTKQGIIVIGRLAPFGIGAGIGGAGNALFGKTVVSGAKRAFGPPPQRWDEEDEPEPVPSSRSDQEHEDAGDSWAGEPRAEDEGHGSSGTDDARHGSIVDELEKLAALRTSGMLTDAEFEQAKKRLFEQMG